MTPLRVLEEPCPGGLRERAAGSVHCVVTSPPYYRVRRYHGLEDLHWPEVRYAPMPELPEIVVPAMACQLGHEPDVSAYIGHLVAVFREVARVLRRDGTAWVNIGDCYSESGGKRTAGMNERTNLRSPGGKQALADEQAMRRYCGARKNLLAIPERLMLALQADGWIVRSRIAWTKANALPESVGDRPANDWEHVFMLTRSRRYFYDSVAVRVPSSQDTRSRAGKNAMRGQAALRTLGGKGNPSYDAALRTADVLADRNLRTTWRIPSEPFHGQHFATFPRALVRPCILAGTSAHGACGACGAPWRRVVRRTGVSSQERRRAAGETRSARVMGVPPQGLAHRGSHLVPGRKVETLGWEASCSCGAGVVPCVVLDPFGGSGTTAGVAIAHGRAAILVEPSAEYRALIPDRVRDVVARETAVPRARGTAQETLVRDVPALEFQILPGAGDVEL